MNQKLYQELKGIRKDVTEIKSLLLNEDFGIIKFVKKHERTLYGNGDKEGLVNKVRNLFYVKLSAIVPVAITIWFFFGDKIKKLIGLGG